MKSAALAVVDVGLLFGYALAISLLARLLIFSDSVAPYGNGKLWLALYLARFAIRFVFVPAAVWLRVLHLSALPRTITEAWVDVGSYASAAFNALLWTGVIVTARVGHRWWQGSLKAHGFWVPVIGSRCRRILAALLPVLLALAASPWTKGARVTAACIDRLARLPVGTSIETVRSVLDNVWSDPRPSLPVWSPASRPYRFDRIPIILDPDTPLVDVLCTTTEAENRRAAWIRLSFVERRINYARVQVCDTWESDLGECPAFGPGVGSPLPGRPSGTVPLVDTTWWAEESSYTVMPPWPRR
jgi:hypothetical protein